MSKMMLTIAFVLSVESVQAQPCTNVDRHSISSALTDVLAECNNEIKAPGRDLTLEIDASGVLHLISQTGAVILGSVMRVEAPATVAWAPDAKAIFINDGQGSGETSRLRVLRLKDRGLEEDARAQLNAVSRFRTREGCAPNTLDPDVYGLGWSSDSRHLYVLVQPTIHRPCAAVDQFVVMIIDATRASIVEVLTPIYARRRFENLLPSQLLNAN